jgi:hypothetical protein
MYAALAGANRLVDADCRGERQRDSGISVGILRDRFHGDLQHLWKSAHNQLLNQIRRRRL